MSVSIEKAILAIVTTSPRSVPAGTNVFHCQNKEEMYEITKNLEAILDGIAHALKEDLFIIVKH
ncbi:capping complex subunit for YIEGIA [Peribacillus sp. SCS-37]|uniref:capping complex subunit for YIEGIA n=1 Tax=Paraperibacillus esterisolvens TaxID=3115296 RepID=UPI003905BF85